MLRAKEWVLVAGLVLAMLGATCLPGAKSPESITSLFAQSADAGAFLSVGVVLLALGIVIACLSFFVPRH